MVTRALLLSLILLGPLALRAETFPGLKAIMTEADWQRAGLDRLGPDQLGIVDAALIRHIARLEMRLTAEAGPAAPTARDQTEAAFGARPPERPLWERFGLPSFNADWRSTPPLTAKVLRWRGTNRFVLDNGQVWEGLQAIPYELVDEEIRIEARPRGQFALVVDGQNTALRVIRVE